MLKTILKLQEKIQEIKEQIDLVETTITAKSVVQEKATVIAPSPLVTLSKKRESLLAAKALGENVSEEDIKELNDAIHEQEKEHDGVVCEAILAAQTISGLNRNLVALKKELSAQEKRHCDEVISYFDQEIDVLGEKYVSAVEVTVECFQRIFALAEIRNKISNKERQILGSYWYNFRIPGFKIDPCRKKEYSDFPGVLFVADRMDQNQVLEREKGHQKKLGLQIK